MKYLTLKKRGGPTFLFICIQFLLIAQISFSQVSDDLVSANPPLNFKHAYADVNGVKIHYVIGGKGKLLVLLHGFGQNWYMWNRLLPELGKHFTVVAPDLRGVGESGKPDSGYNKRTMAEDIHHLVLKLGYTKTYMAAHDIGLMVAYAYATRYPEEIIKLALLDALVPGIEPMWMESSKQKWWFSFFKWQNADEIIEGKEKLFLTSFYDPGTYMKESFTKDEIIEFIRAYSVKGALNSTFNWFRAFDQDVKDNQLKNGKGLTMPVLALGGDHSNAVLMAAQMKLLAENCSMIIIKDSGHWLVQEQTEQVQKQLLEFFRK